jgi:hypothetical protein
MPAGPDSFWAKIRTPDRQQAGFDNVALATLSAVGLCVSAARHESRPYGTSSAFGATFGARRKYLSMSLGFADPARSRRKSSAAASILF